MVQVKDLRMPIVNPAHLVKGLTQLHLVKDLTSLHLVKGLVLPLKCPAMLLPPPHLVRKVIVALLHRLHLTKGLATPLRLVS